MKDPELDLAKIFVLIPALNVSGTLPGLLQSLVRYVQPSQIVVVDDGSTDRTKQVAEDFGAIVLRHDRNRGKGAALRTGLDFLRRHPDIDCVITLDADLQHSPDDLPAFLEARRADGADILVGRRRKQGSSMPLARRMSNAVTSWLTTARTGVPILDSQCGYRLIRRAVLEAVSLEADGYEAETEFLIKSAQRGFTIRFVPIKTIYGNERSYMTHWQTTRRFLQTLMREY